MGEIYPFEHAANLKLENFRSDAEYIEELINQEPPAKKEEEPAEDKEASGKEKNKKEKENKQEKQEKPQDKQDKQDKSKKSVKKVKDILFRLLPCLHQGMIDQLLKDRNIGPNGKVNDTHIPILQQITEETIQFLKEFINSDPKGYLSYKEIPKEEVKMDGQINGEDFFKDEVVSVRSEKPKLKYFEFSPLPIKGAENVKEFDSFNKAVDEFFANLNVVIVKPQDEKKRLAYKKYENIKVSLRKIDSLT